MVRPTNITKSHQQTVRTRKLQAFIGMEGSEADALNRNYVNVDPQAVQVSTIQATTSTVSADYVFTFNGVVYTMTEDGTTTGVNDIATQLAAFINAAGSIYGFLTAVAVTDTVTLTGRLSGYSWTVSDADGKITTVETVTAAADAAEVTFGRAVARGGYAAGTVNDVEDSIERGALAQVSFFTAQVDTWTLPDPTAGEWLGMNLSIKGVAEDLSVQVLFDTNLATTIDALDLALAQVIADAGATAYLTVTNGPTTLILTAAIAGVEFTSQGWSSIVGTVSVASNKLLSHGAGRTSIHSSLAGIALRVGDEEAALNFDANSVGTYDINSHMKVRERGDVWVQNSQTILTGQQVFIDMAASQGLFFNAGGATLIPLDLSQAEWVKGGRSIDGEAIALLRLL